MANSNPHSGHVTIPEGGTLLVEDGDVFLLDGQGNRTFHITGNASGRWYERVGEIPDHVRAEMRAFFGRDFFDKPGD